jgi:hypothetical protein
MNLDHGRGQSVQCGHCVQMDDWQEQGSCYQKVGQSTTTPAIVKLLIRELSPGSKAR